jgi:hypothetical protein
MSIASLLLAGALVAGCGPAVTRPEVARPELLTLRGKATIRHRPSAHKSYVNCSHALRPSTAGAPPMGKKGHRPKKRKAAEVLTALNMPVPAALKVSVSTQQLEDA